MLGNHKDSKDLIEKRKILDEQLSNLARLEEQMISQHFLKTGVHLTRGELLRMVQENQLNSKTVPASRTESQFGFWLSSGEFIPQEEMAEYLLAEIDHHPTGTVCSSPAAVPGTLFNQLPVMTGSVKSIGNKTDELPTNVSSCSCSVQ